MKLKELMNLRSRTQQKLSELQQKRDAIALVTLEAGERWEDYLLPSERVDLLTEQIDGLMEKLLEMTSLVRQANHAKQREGVIRLEPGESISDLIERSILYRSEAERCSRLGRNRPRKRTSSYTERGNLIEQATYDIEKMAKRGEQLEKKAQELSDQVEKLDMEVEVEPFGDNA